MEKDRAIVWFSCGVTSAIAAKLALNKYKHLPVVIAYTDTGSEHPDNKRFLKECEEWFGQEITILKSEKYADIWEVFEKTRYLAGINGARCTVELKKTLRHKFERCATDIQVFGFDASEEKRADRFRNNNPEVTLDTPLIDRGLYKEDCLALLEKANIELPAMYKLGYRNNNCIGCVKGQQKYWNKIRVDFPDVFDRMSKVERKLNAAINKTYAGGKGRQRLFLDEMDPEAGRDDPDMNIECGILCVDVARELDECDD